MIKKDATAPNNYVAKLSSAENGHKIGPGITLKVMAGDQVSIRVSSWYKANGNSPGTPVNPLNDLLVALIGGIGGLPAGGHPSTAILQANSATLSPNTLQFLQDTAGKIANARPLAFVNWVLFDNQFNYVASSSGFEQVGADQELKKHNKPNLLIDKSGYLYIYTSNETPNIDVFFDNLQVTHTRGPLLEEDHYYPFGLTMAGISDKVAKMGYAENKYLYNKGSELQNKEFSDWSGLEVYETQLRSLDPQLGRWWQVDSKPDQAESPYVAMGNNPILHNDPLGDSLVLPNASVTFREKFNQATANLEAHGVGEVYAKAMDSKTPDITVVETNKSSTWDPKTQVLSWNPEGGIATSEGHSMSPTTVLNHELDHAVQDKTNHNKFNKDSKSQTGDGYDDKEEKRVITGTEQKTALALGEIKPGEVTRKDHGGFPIKTAGPTTNKTEKQLKNESEKDNNNTNNH